MRFLLRWLIFHGLAPRTDWFRRITLRWLHRWNVYGDSVIDLGPSVTAQQVHLFQEWWRRDD